MFKLVGKETFSVGKSETKATINIDAVSGFAYEYTLEINGKSLKKYMENRSKVTSTWILNLDGTDCRVVLGEYHPHLKLNLRYTAFEKLSGRIYFGLKGFLPEEPKTNMSQLELISSIALNPTPSPATCVIKSNPLIIMLLTVDQPRHLY